MVTVFALRAASHWGHWQSVNQKSSIIVSSNSPAAYSKIAWSRSWVAMSV